MDITLEQRIRRFLKTLPGFSSRAPRLECLVGDASTRRYYRAIADSTSVIVTAYPRPFDTTRSALERFQAEARANPEFALRWANDPLAQLELTSFLSHHAMRVPRIIGVHGPDGLIACQDLGDTTLSAGLSSLDSEGRRVLYGQAIQLLTALQRLTKAATSSGLIAGTLRFTREKLMWELDFFLKHFFDCLLAQSHPLSRREDIRDELRQLCDWLAGRPTTLCHRDYHARNLMFHAGELTLIDFQDARLGPITYDLVSLLLDPYVPTAWADVPSLRLEFHTCAGISDDAVFQEEWTAMGIQRLIKASGTYAYQVSILNNTSFFKYLQPTLEVTLELMACREDLSHTRAAIQEGLCHLRDRSTAS